MIHNARVILDLKPGMERTALLPNDEFIRLQRLRTNKKESRHTVDFGWLENLRILARLKYIGKMGKYWVIPNDG